MSVEVAGGRVVVIGGGITGLAAAHRLTTLLPGTAITLVEREPRLGGKIRTERTDGFVIEGGPDSFLSAKPRGLGLCRELGLGDRLHGPDEANRRTFVLRRGELHRLPEGLTGLIPTRLGPMARTRLISPRGKARMALDFVLPPRKGNADESLASFIERRLGTEVYRNLVEPLMAGIYVGDGRQLSLAATFPQLRAAERRHGGLIKGVLAARREAETPTPNVNQPPKPGFLTLPTGLAELVETLADRLAAAGVDVRTGISVAAIEKTDSGYRLTLDTGDTFDADAVVVATEAWAAAPLLRALDPALGDAHDAIPHVSSATVALAFRTAELAQPLHGFGYIVPRVEGRPVLASTWLSAKWPGRAPEGFTLVRGFVGRAGCEEVLNGADESLVDLVRDELRDTLGITALPTLHRVTRWPRGMPQYTLGHLERIAAIDRAVAALPGLAIAGNAFTGVGIPDCIRSGESAAERVASSVLATYGPAVHARA
jgi:oxygen-dependent protoporphyrinogen oxidase